jgi:hypothetical protein
VHLLRLCGQRIAQRSTEEAQDPAPEARRLGEARLQVVAEQAPVEVDDLVEATAVGLAASEIGEQSGGRDGEALVDREPRFVA